MEAKMAQSIKFSTWIGSEKIARKPNGLLQFSLRTREQNGLQIRHLQPTRTASCHKRLALKVSCFHKNIPGSVLKSASFPDSFDNASCDEAMVLKNKSEEIEPNLNGRCIFLVGMMGSGKTTIGRILSEALGYSFFDCDTLIEQAAGVTVAEIFKLHGESFFRDNEKLPLMKGQHVIIEGSGPVVTGGCHTETLRKLSSMQRLVVSTGGGVVIRPINWRYMQKGISVWLDVPLEALARRIASVGTQSRPLLHQESGDAYEKAFTRLSALLEERGEEYSNANTRVSLQSIAAKHGEVDVCNLTPTVIAIEALEQIERFLEKDGK